MLGREWRIRRLERTLRMKIVNQLPCLAVALATGVLVGSPCRAVARGTMEGELDAGTRGTIRFFGSRSAELFTREVAESFRGVLEKDFIREAGGSMPPGFVQASPAGQG